MFFSIAQGKKSNFPINLNLHDFWLNLDQGWTVETRPNCTVVYKGYTDDFVLGQNLDLILAQTDPKYLGNFCVFEITTDVVKIKTDLLRSFPIWVVPGQEITNLEPKPYTCWTDSVVTVTADLHINETKFDAIGSTQPIKNLSVAQAIDQITEILDRKTQAWLAQHPEPIKVYLSGGVDTTLVYSFLKKHGANCDIVAGETLEYDYFWLKNSGTIKKFWGYRQIHHWRDSAWLTSGTPGDEFMLRSPTTTDLWLRYHGINIVDLLRDRRWHWCLHRNYFLMPKHQEIFDSPKELSTNSIYHICNILINDWQHWHLGRTLTWTPLRDLGIVKIFLSLPVADTLGQIMNSDISVAIIERNVPGLSSIISDSKNTGNELANLTRLII